MSGPADEDELWEAIADPTRRKVLDLLVTHGNATATMLTAEMPVTRQAITKHLALLQRAGLVDSRKEGREVRYQVREERLGEAARALSDASRRWDQRLRVIKRLAEEAHAADRER